MDLTLDLSATDLYYHWYTHPCLISYVFTIRGRVCRDRIFLPSVNALSAIIGGGVPQDGGVEVLLDEDSKERFLSLFGGPQYCREAEDLIRVSYFELPTYYEYRSDVLKCIVISQTPFVGGARWGLTLEAHELADSLRTACDRHCERDLEERDSFNAYCGEAPMTEEAREEFREEFRARYDRVWTYPLDEDLRLENFKKDFFWDDYATWDEYLQTMLPYKYEDTRLYDPPVNLRADWVKVFYEYLLFCIKHEDCAERQDLLRETQDLYLRTWSWLANEG